MIVPSARSILLAAPTIPGTPYGAFETVSFRGEAVLDPLFVILRIKFRVVPSCTSPKEKFWPVYGIHDDPSGD